MKRTMRWGVCLLALGLLIYLLASSAPLSPRDPTAGTAIYYLDASEDAQGGDALRPCIRDLGLQEDATPVREAIAVIQQLLEDPPEDDLRSPMPQVELQGLRIQDQCAYVDLSTEFSRLTGVDLTLADYCLTLSLTGLADISAVAITVQGQPVGHQPKSIFYERDVLLSTMEDAFRSVSVTLYFPDEDGLLLPETRVLQLYEGQTLAEAILGGLMEGPSDRSLTAVIPKGLSYYSIRVDGGVCTLNLVASSLEFLPEDTAAQERILHSVFQSLYSIDAIQEIHLTADGENLDFFGSVPVAPLSTRPVLEHVLPSPTDPPLRSAGE